MYVETYNQDQADYESVYNEAIDRDDFYDEAFEGFESGNDVAKVYDDMANVPDWMGMAGMTPPMVDAVQDAIHVIVTACWKEFKAHK